MANLRTVLLGILIILFGMTSLCAESQEIKPLFDEHFEPETELVEILQLVGMKTASTQNLAQINEWAQQNLLRRGERWEEQTQKFEGLKPELLPLLTDLGFVDAVVPTSNEYEGAIVHGALLPTVCLRLSYLVEEWEHGIRFSHLYFLSGERPLEPSENEAILKQKSEIDEPPKTECEMIQFVWEQFEIPKDMSKRLM